MIGRMDRLRAILHWKTLIVAVGSLVAAALVAAPAALAFSVERVHFEDRIGTLPVRASLCHNGYSSLDTGVLGTLYWKKTGMFGFGACVRSTGPPEAGGTLSSYVNESFVRANAEVVNDPQDIADAYGHTFLRAFWAEFLRVEALLTALGLFVLIALRRAGDRSEPLTPWWGRRVVHRLAPWPRVRQVLWPALVLVLALGSSVLYAVLALGSWTEDQRVGTTYALPGDEALSFSSPQTREIATQVEPFLKKNEERLAERGRQYEDEAASTFSVAIAARAAELKPRAGEHVVLAEADPQGSLVGTAVRTRLYPMLLDALGSDAVALRTIAGDITSNGTVAEDGYVEREARSSGKLPVAAASGDHDSPTTVEQMKRYGITVPNLSTTSIGGHRVTAGNDPEFKTLFGGMVTNPSGVSEQQLGEKLRSVVDPSRAGIVVVHQPDAAAAYLGISSLTALRLGHQTTPYDDGIPDVPPGVIDVGHSHVSLGPYVVWNTDTDHVTWTVVDRLGTSGGAENSPTFNRFSTPFSVPLKPIDVRLQYFDDASGLETGYATIAIDTSGHATVSGRTEVGIPIR